MSEARDLLAETAARFFADRSSEALHAQVERGEWPGALWAEAGELGLTTIARSAERDGAGFDLDDLGALLIAAGRAAFPLPLAEAAIAELVLAGAGLAPAEGVATISGALDCDTLRVEQAGSGWVVFGTLHQVPWGRHADMVVAAADGPDGLVTLALPRAARVEPGTNHAGEPRDRLSYENVPLPADAVAPGTNDLRILGAWTRVMMMSGALSSILDRTVGYAGDRVQFGKPIGKFQAVQQQLAMMAAQIASASAAANGATAALEITGGELEIALAKVRVGEAATMAAAIAHQVHAAIGFAREYALHLSTRRLWSWREEYGGESEWAARIGRIAASGSGGDLWPLLTAAERG